MAFQSAPECAEAVLNFATAGKNMANVMNFWKPLGYDAAGLQDLADAIDGEVGDSYLATISSGTTYFDTAVRGLELENDLVRTANAEAGVGTASGSALNSNASLCVTLRTDFTGRSARGRFYAMPTTVTNTTAADHYSSGYADAVQGFLGDVQAAAFAAGWILVVLSRWSNKVKRTEAIHFTVTDIAYRNLLADSQRNRLPSGH